MPAGRKAKYAKPYPSFPLTPYGGGWCKKIAGKKRHVCGHLPPDEALDYWEANAKAIRARFEADAEPATVRLPADEWAVADVARYWLEDQAERVDAAQLTASYYADCRRAARMVLEHVGADRLVDTLAPDDFRKLRQAVLARYRDARTRRLMLVLGRAMFRAAADDEQIDRLPNFGRRYLADLKPVASEVSADAKAFSRAECRALLRHAGRAVARSKTSGRGGGLHRRAYDSAIQVRAMLWLGLNGGYHAAELAALPRSAIDVDRGRIDRPRPKTKAMHRVVLWPETLAALRPVLADARKHRPQDRLVFRTSGGQPWVRADVKRGADGEITAVHPQSAIAQAFRKLSDAAGVERNKRGIHGLRHTHRSASGGAGDEAAADVLVGHRLAGMRAVYQHVDWQRLERVANHVRAWLLRGG